MFKSLISICFLTFFLSLVPKFSFGATDWPAVEAAARDAFLKYEGTKEYLEKHKEHLGLMHFTVLSHESTPGTNYRILVTQEYMHEGKTKSFSTLVYVSQTPGQITETYANVSSRTKVLCSEVLEGLFF